MAAQAYSYSVKRIVRGHLTGIALVLALLFVGALAIVAYRAAVTDDVATGGASSKAVSIPQDRPTSLGNLTERSTATKAYHVPEAGEGLLGNVALDAARVQPLPNIDRADALRFIRENTATFTGVDWEHQQLVEFNLLPGDTVEHAVPNAMTSDQLWDLEANQAQPWSNERTETHQYPGDRNLIDR